MTTSETCKYRLLVSSGVMAEDDFQDAVSEAEKRGIELERVLLYEFGIPRPALLTSLSEFYKCPFIEYDERMPVAPQLLAGLDGERLSLLGWFPVIRDGNTVVVAAKEADNAAMLDDAQKSFPSDKIVVWAALQEDIEWFIEDYLHAVPGLLIGTERTGLAFWRNTMAQWRTRLACYRTDLAKARTDLGMLRWGLGSVAIADALLHAGRLHLTDWGFLLGVPAIAALTITGLTGYLKIRKSRLSPPGHATLVEVTSAVVQFLENYHHIEGAYSAAPSKKTMLARLYDSIGSHCSILYPSPPSRERTHLARQRNVLAARRTVAACYRTIYARARTGLAFIRTGASFSGLGFGLMKYFGFSAMTFIDSVLLAAGALLIADGLMWYLPVRKEQAEAPEFITTPQVDSL